MPNKSNNRILIVDDNRQIHSDFRKIFNVCSKHDIGLSEMDALLFGEEEKHDGGNSAFNIDSAYQGEEALNRVIESVEAGSPYSMAFVDVRMPPGWDGIETSQRIWEVDPEIQVVLCTAYSDYSWEEVISKMGRSDRLVILKKPFDNVEALQLANALTEKWKLQQAAKDQICSLKKEATQKRIQLDEAETRFRLIAENVNDFISVVDSEGVYRYLSPSYERLLGYSGKELEGSDALSKVHPEDRLAVKEKWRTTFEGEGTGELVEYRFQSKGGDWRFFESQASTIKAAAGELQQLVVFCRDVTSRMEQEEKRRQREVQVRHSQKMESIGQLAAGIAHEINTPIQYIGDNTRFLQDSFSDLDKLIGEYRGFIQSAIENSEADGMVLKVKSAEEALDLEYLTGEIPTAIEQTLNGVGQISRIVKAMKEFSHPGTDGQTQVDLNQAIESTITVARNEWKYVAEVELELSPELQPVSCYPGEFNQAILNLVTNAAHAIGDDPNRENETMGSIKISTSSTEDGVEIRIADSGPGIPEEIREKVFEPFFTTKEVGRGTGQGLSIVHSVIVEKHKGRVALESELGRGTTFILWIPNQLPEQN